MQTRCRAREAPKTARALSGIVNDLTARDRTGGNQPSRQNPHDFHAQGYAPIRCFNRLAIFV